MIRLGASTACLFSKAYNEEALDIYNEFGISVVEVFLTTFSEYEKSFVDELCRRKKQLEIYSVHTLNQHFEPELFSKHDRARDDAESILKKICYAIKALDAKYYTFHGPARLKRTPYNINFENFGKRLDELNSFIKKYAGQGELVYENVHWSYFNSSEFFEAIKPYTSVSTCLDIKQAMQSKHDCYEYMQVMGDRLKNVHICDWDEDGKLKMCGEGVFDYETFFKRLNDSGYDGAVLLEVYPESYGGIDDVKRCFEKMQNCLYKALH